MKTEPFNLKNPMSLKLKLLICSTHAMQTKKAKYFTATQKSVWNRSAMVKDTSALRGYIRT